MVETLRPSMVTACDAILLELDAAQVRTSISVDCRLPSLGAAASATTTLPIVTGVVADAAMLKTPELVEL